MAIGYAGIREVVINKTELIERMIRKIIDLFSVNQITVDYNGLVVIEDKDYAWLINSS